MCFITLLVVQFITLRTCQIFLVKCFVESDKNELRRKGSQSWTPVKNEHKITEKHK